MKMKEFNNIAKISGILLEEFNFSHKSQQKEFYTTRVLVKRDSGRKDIIHIVIPKKFFLDNIANTYARIYGQFRSFNEDGEDGKKHLKLFLYVNDIRYFQCPNDENCIDLRGFICKEPKFKQKKSGDLITEFCLAVNRRYYKCDYIPCIAWDYYAINTANLTVGDEIRLVGKMQRREYTKHDNPEDVKETFEVVISWVEKITK